MCFALLGCDVFTTSRVQYYCCTVAVSPSPSCYGRQRFMYDVLVFGLKPSGYLPSRLGNGSGVIRHSNHSSCRLSASLLTILLLRRDVSRARNSFSRYTSIDKCAQENSTRMITLFLEYTLSRANSYLGVCSSGYMFDESHATEPMRSSAIVVVLNLCFESINLCNTSAIQKNTYCPKLCLVFSCFGYHA